MADAMIKASKPMLEIRFSLLIATRVFENLTAPCPTIRTRARDEPAEMSCQCRGKRTIQPIVYMNIRETSQLFVRLLHKPHVSVDYLLSSAPPEDATDQWIAHLLCDDTQEDARD